MLCDRWVVMSGVVVRGGVDVDIGPDNRVSSIARSRGLIDSKGKCRPEGRHFHTGGGGRI